MTSYFTKDCQTRGGGISKRLPIGQIKKKLPKGCPTLPQSPKLALINSAWGFIPQLMSAAMGGESDKEYLLGSAHGKKMQGGLFSAYGYSKP